MFGIGATEIVIVGLMVTVPLVLLFLMTYALRRGQQGRQSSTEEAQAIRELLQGLKRLEERMDSLETILLERRGKD